MKLRPLLEVRYAGSLEAEIVLYTLWEERNKIQKDNRSVALAKNPALSKKRDAAVARYAVRVIAPEALDAVGMIDEAQKLRDLPPDVDLDRACDAARGAATSATSVRAAAVNTAAVNTAAAAADAAAYPVDAADAARAAAYNAVRAAYYVGKVTNKQRHIYHLDQMIKIAADIK